MTATDSELSTAVRELAIFCLSRRGNNWNGWTANKIFQYLTWHYLNRTLFVAFKGGNLCGVSVVWTNDSEDIKRRDAERRPQFEWQQIVGNSLMIAEVFGDRKACQAMWAVVKSKWPVEKAFTYRKKRQSNQMVLKEFTPELMGRFMGEKGGDHGQS